MVHSLLQRLSIPMRARSATTADSPVALVWVSKKVTSTLQNLCHRACLHPIHTIVIVAALASTTYIRLLEGGLFESATFGKADWTSLNDGSRQLRVGAETGWKWQTTEAKAPLSNEVDHLALLNFDFSDSLAASSPQSVPGSHTVPLPQNISVTELPSTSNPLSAISQETALTYSIPYDQAAEFLARVQELLNVSILPKNETARHGYEAEPVKEERMWIMKVAKTSATKSSVRNWASFAWTESVNLMVSRFVIVNILNLYTSLLRGGKSNAQGPNITGLSVQGFANIITSRPMDPFKVAPNGLDAILKSAKSNHKSTVVTILTSIKYELEYPSIYYGNIVTRAPLETQNPEGREYSRVVDSPIESFEDPILSTWILFTFALSVILNGYLFNAATAEPPKLPAIGSGAEDTTLPSTVTGVDEEKDGVIMPTRQTKPVAAIQPATSSALQPALPRTQAQMEQMLKEKRAPEMTDRELVELSLQGKIAGYALEKTLGDTTRAVKIRRSIISCTPATTETTSLLEGSLLPYEHYDFDRVLGACCENVIGYLPLPVGVAGPIVIDGQSFFIPMATTEGVLVASTSRGSKAINAGGGVTTVLVGDGMTRGPCVSFESLARAGAAKIWLDSKAGQKTMTDAFNSTSQFARLQSIKTSLAGTYLYPRFKTTTGDAMGMNMISKGVEHALKVMATSAGFNDMKIISVSGNMCTDKKAAAINWIDGRGKSVVAEAIIPADVVRKVLKSNVDDLVELNIAKNLVGSALAGAMGGFNAHAANIVAAIFLATGQDPAQVVESANCITLMKKNIHGDLQISVSMPSIEVGTLGGGTILEPQAAMLDMLGVRGSHPTVPGDNARKLARIIAATVLAGELSLCSALRAGHLVKSHMAHNRSVSNVSNSE